MLIEAQSFSTGLEITRAKSLIQSRFDRSLPTYVTSVGPDTSGKTNPRKSIYRITVVGKMPVIKVPIEGSNIFVSTSLVENVKSVCGKFGNLPSTDKTFHNFKNLLMTSHVTTLGNDPCSRPADVASVLLGPFDDTCGSSANLRAGTPTVIETPPGLSTVSGAIQSQPPHVESSQ